MEFRTRHQAMAWYGVISLIVVLSKYAAGESMDFTEIGILIAPFVGMFTWDKIKGGSIAK